MTILQAVSAIIIILATVINIYFVYWNYAIKRPVLDIKLEGLPPYKDETQKTVLKLKNVGTRETAKSPLVVLSCSWMPSISYKFNFPTDKYVLDVNEEIIWRFRIDKDFTPNSTVAVRIYDKSLSWELHEQL